MRTKRLITHSLVRSAAFFASLGNIPDAGPLQANKRHCSIYKFAWKGHSQMKTDTRMRVLNLLKTYSKRKQKIEALRYELAHPARTSHAEQLEAMSYAHSDTEGRPSIGHISDKTLYIALNYQDKVDKLNSSVVDEVAGQLIETEQEQSRLEYYVSLLEPRQAEVIRRIYFKPESQGAVAKGLNISVRTVQVVKAQAIDALVELYSLTDRQR